MTKSNWAIITVFALKILSAFSVFMYQKELANIWTPEDLGLFSSNLGIVMFTSAISNWGKAKGIIRLKSLNFSHDEFKYLVGFSLKRILVVTTMLTITAFVISRVKGDFVFSPMLFVIPLSSCSYFFADYYKAHNSPVLSVLTWSALFNILLAISVFTLSETSVLKLVVVMIFSQVLLFALFLANNGTRVVTADYDNIRKSYLKMTNALGWNQIYEEVIRWTPLLILGFFDLAGAAIFTVAQKFVFIIHLVLSIINTIIPGKITALIAENKHSEVFSIIRNAQNFMLVSGSVLAIIIVLGSNLLLGFFGDYYLDNGKYALIFLMIGAVIHGFSDIRLLYFQISGHEETARDISKYVAILQGVILPCALLLGGLEYLCIAMIVATVFKVFLLRAKMNILISNGTGSF